MRAGEEKRAKTTTKPGCCCCCCCCCFPTADAVSGVGPLDQLPPSKLAGCPTAIARKAASEPAAAAGLEPGGSPAKGAGGSEAESSPRRLARRAWPTALAAADSGDAAGGCACEEEPRRRHRVNSTDVPSDIATLAATTAATAAAAGGHTAATGVLVGGNGPSSPAMPLEAAAEETRARG